MYERRVRVVDQVTDQVKAIRSLTTSKNLNEAVISAARRQLYEASLRICGGRPNTNAFVAKTCSCSYLAHPIREQKESHLRACNAFAQYLQIWQ